MLKFIFGRLVCIVFAMFVMEVSFAGMVTGVRLNPIITSPDLYSNVISGGELQVYGGGAFGTFLAVTNSGAPSTWPLFGPAVVPAGSAVTSTQGYARWTYGTQAVSGSGTASDPWKMVTAGVGAGSTGITIQQTDTLVDPDEFYQTDIVVTNTSGQDKEIILYRAMDCKLGANDAGFGEISDTAVGCIRRDTDTSPNNNSDPTSPISRIEEFKDLTGGAKKELNFYQEIWSIVGARGEFGDKCAPDCDEYQDNGMGLSWRVVIRAGESKTFSHTTLFSPKGQFPITTSAVALPGTSPQGGVVGYTITLSNPNANNVTMDSVSFALPDGFSYVANSSAANGFSAPALAGNTLTWSGACSVPGNNGQISITFNVQVGQQVAVGAYTGDVSGTAQNYSVVSSLATARVEVTAADPKPVDPTPDGSTPEDPTPVNPTPVDPTPVNPVPENPTPINPTPLDPVPVDPTPVDPAPVDPGNGNSAQASIQAVPATGAVSLLMGSGLICTAAFAAKRRKHGLRKARRGKEVVPVA